jgi:catechol 2,3-dioxygenase-like lactoylglutathione lyase family enzyme
MIGGSWLVDDAREKTRVTNPFSAVNHVGVVVSNLDEGARFLTDVLGFAPVPERTGRLAPNGDTLTRRFGVDANADGRFAFFRLGDNLIELLEWSAPGRNETAPLNSDLGGRHLAFSVSDIDAAVERLKSVPGVTIREPNDAGYIYGATPLGLEIQLISV